MATSTPKKPTGTRKELSLQRAVEQAADADVLAHSVVRTISAFTKGQAVQFDFLSLEAVGRFCTSLGIRRNWGKLTLDEIAPADSFGINVVPTGEADKVLGLLAALIRDGHLKPKNHGKPAPEVLNDFLQTPKQFQGEPTLGHVDEFAYALAVELEHGRERGQNITMNHPLMTGMVVMAHLAEDTLYYARLRVMEAEGELFDQQCHRKPFQQIHESLAALADARARLAAREKEKLEQV